MLASATASPKKKHIHDPHWTGAAEFIRTNALNDNATGFAKDGFRDELITENAKKGDAVGGGDDGAGDVEDGDDAAEDAFTETPDELTRKRPPSRRARASA